MGGGREWVCGIERYSEIWLKVELLTLEAYCNIFFFFFCTWVKVQTSPGVGLLNEQYGLLELRVVSFFLPGILGKIPNSLV